jgi:hypothetical protein
MKYRVAIYDLVYDIEAKSTEGAIRAAIARYAKTERAQTSRHCSPDRLTRGPKVVNGRRSSRKPAASPQCIWVVGFPASRAPLRSRSINLPQSSPRPLPNQREQNRSVPLHLIVGR